MKEMAVLGPQLKVIQEKYKDDKQRQQTEMWALYKENGVSPVAGCLPMFLQMPIWIALYRTLSSRGRAVSPAVHLGVAARPDRCRSDARAAVRAGRRRCSRRRG